MNLKSTAISLFCMLFLPYSGVFAQIDELVGNFRIKPEKRIEMPIVKSNSNLYFAYLIKNKEDYYAVFDEKEHSKLLNIDFTQYMLVGTKVCYTCLKKMEKDIYLVKEKYGGKYYYAIDYSIDYNTGHVKCIYDPVWFLVKKTTPKTVDFKKLPIEETKYFLNAEDVVITTDTMFRTVFKDENKYEHLKPDFSKYVLLGKPVGGDCKARFQYEVVDDPSNKTYTLNIYNIYGGCRAAGFWEHWIQIPKAPDGYSYKFEVFRAK